MENQTYNKDIISESEAKTIPHSNPMRDRIFQVLEQNIELDEDSISKLYKEADNDKITLLCSYCTKIEGLLDILLSQYIISSKETYKGLGKVHTHRGDTMGSGTLYHDTNDYISFSTGFISYKYIDISIQNKENFEGGYGIFTPLQTLLEKEHLYFSHCSSKGEIKGYDLNKENIINAVHITRKLGELYDDGYGNMFEIGPQGTNPRINISQECIVAIPLTEKHRFKQLLIERQEIYKDIYKIISTLSDREIMDVTIKERQFYYPQKTKEIIELFLKPIDIDTLPIYWYPQKNIHYALQYLSLHK